MVPTTKSKKAQALRMPGIAAAMVWQILCCLMVKLIGRLRGFVSSS
jgi:hypothetical protein